MEGNTALGEIIILVRALYRKLLHSLVLLREINAVAEGLTEVQQNKKQFAQQYGKRLSEFNCCLIYIEIEIFLLKS